MAIVNSHIIFLAANPRVKNNRSEYKEELGKGLIKERLQNRLGMKSVSKELRSIITKALGTEISRQVKLGRKVLQ